jgi:hypothetical protein
MGLAPAAELELRPLAAIGTVDQEHDGFKTG